MVSMQRSVLGFCVLLVNLVFAAQVYAADLVKLPPINLGTTAFMDGMAGPGTLVQVSSNLSRVDSFNNDAGDSLPGNNSMDVNVLLFQLAHITNSRLAGGFYGVEVLLPYSDINPDTSLPGLPDQDESGVGDLLVSPFMLQWVGDSLFGKRYFHRLNLIFSLPTGSYDPDNDVNPGVNLVKFNPYYAGTLELSSKLSTSFRLHYLWNSKNKNPPSFMNASSIQPGTAFHMNYALSYEVNPGLRIGLAGYYLKQLSEDRIDGIRQEDSEESIIAIGPGLRWSRKGGFFNLNAYVESDAENRVEGTRLLARYAWVFR